MQRGCLTFRDNISVPSSGVMQFKNGFNPEDGADVRNTTED